MPLLGCILKQRLQQLSEYYNSCTLPFAKSTHPPPKLILSVICANHITNHPFHPNTCTHAYLVVHTSLYPKYNNNFEYDYSKYSISKE